MRSFDLKRSSKEEVKSYGIIENVTKEETRFLEKISELGNLTT
jgi:hypothetical protein